MGGMPPGGYDPSHIAQLHTEQWRLVGPGIRELPSPAYLHLLEQHEPGTITGVVKQINADVEYSRKQHELRDNRAYLQASLRSYACLVYALVALIASAVMFYTDHIRPGALLAILSGFGLVLGADLPSHQPPAWFTKITQREKRTKSATAKKRSEAAAANKAQA